MFCTFRSYDMHFVYPETRALTILELKCVRGPKIPSG
jgi:hypothetical protein